MNKKGFTLVELLASITIIALLAVIIIPMSLNLIDKSNIEQCNRMVDTILSGAELCYLDKFDDCYVDSGTKTVNLKTLYINGYIEKEYTSESTAITINYDNIFKSYTVTIDVTNGYPEYKFNNPEFCG